MSLPSTEADVNITLNARDRASAQIETATQRINRQWKDMRNDQRAVERQFEINNRTWVQTGRVLGSLGSIVNRVRGLYNTFLLQQIRNQQIAQSVRDAQIQLNDAISEFGPSSREALDANRNLTDEIQKQKDAQNENILTWIFTIGLFAQSIPTINRLIGRLRTLRNVGLGASAAAAKTPTAGITAAGGGAATTVGKGASIFSKISSAAGKLPLGGLGLGSALFLAQLAGEQQAGGGEEGGVATGIDALKEIGGDIVNSVTNIFNINASTSEDIIREIENTGRRFSTFGQGG